MNEDEVLLLKDALISMIRSRKFEERLIELYKRGMIQGPLHLGIGHEATSVGLCIALNKEDYVFPHHRGLGYYMPRGTDLKKMMAEWFGKKTGLCGGKGGAIHAADLKNNIMGITGIVGGFIPISTGLALSVKMKGSSQIVACCFGDGSVNQGVFHETLNLASIWKLPILYVCENNMYAISTSIENSTAVTALEMRAKVYGIPGQEVDGMDILKVVEAVRKASVHIRKNSGPYFLNCKLYRHYGHSMNDNREYRTKQEEENWLARDPIKTTIDTLINAGSMKEIDIKSIIEKADIEIEEAVEFAKNSPEPTEEDLLKDVYFNSN